MEIYFKKQPSELSDRSRAKNERNLEKLSRFVREGNYESRVEVDVTRNSSARKSEGEWKANLHLDVGGDRFNSNAVGNTAEKAISIATKELRSELVRIKEKTNTSTKKRPSMWDLFKNGLNA